MLHGWKWDRGITLDTRLSQQETITRLAWGDPDLYSRVTWASSSFSCGLTGSKVFYCNSVLRNKGSFNFLYFIGCHGKEKKGMLGCFNGCRMFSSFPVETLPHYCLIWSMCVCLCVCERVGDAYSCMHLCVASWQNVGHEGTAAPWRALTWKWPKPHSLQYRSVCVHPLSLFPSLSFSFSMSPYVGQFIYILCFSLTLIIHVFVNILEPSPCLVHFTPLPLNCIFIFIHPPLFRHFLGHHCFIVTQASLSFVC